MKKIFFLVLLSFLCKSLLVSQSKQDTMTVEMNSLLITGSRIGYDASKTPSNIVTINNPVEKNPGAKNLTYLLKSIEGIYSYDASGIGMTGTLNMRGFYGGMSSHHLILIDDIPQNKTTDKLVDFDLINMNDIEKIEIIKGPASALYGDNAFSGVINIKTKNIALTNQYNAKMSCGSFNTQNYELGSSGRITDDFGYKAQLNRSSSDGFRDNTDYKNNRIKLKTDYRITKSQIVDLSYDYTNINRGCTPWALTEEQLKKSFTMARPGSDQDESEATQNRFNLGYRNEFTSSLYFDVKINYKKRDEESFYTSGSAYTSTKERSEKEKSYDINLLFVHRSNYFGMDNYISFGCDIEKNDFDYLEWSAPNKLRGALSKDYNISRKKYGPFVQDEISLIQPLKLTIGARYDIAKIDFSDNKTKSNSNDFDVNDFSPKIGMVYSYLNNSNLFFSYAYAFRTPTIGQLFTYGSSSNIDLKSEEGKSYEFGIRHYVGDIVIVSLNYFAMNVDNEIWYDYSEKKYKNYGKTKHNGIESKIEAFTGFGLTGFANYTYNKAKNDGGQNDGKLLPNVPESKGSFGVGYLSELGFSVNMAVSTVGSFYIDDPNTIKLDGYTTASVNLYYKYKLISFFIDIDNIFNEHYYPYGYLSGTTKYYNPAPDKRVYLAGLEINI